MARKSPWSGRVALVLLCLTLVAPGADETEAYAEEKARPLWRVGLGGATSSEDCDGLCPVEWNPWATLEAHAGVDGPGIPSLGLELFYLSLVRRETRVTIRHVSASLVAGHDVHPRVSIAGALGWASLRGTEVDSMVPVLYKRGLDLGGRVRYAVWRGDEHRFDVGLKLDYIATDEGRVWMGGFNLLFGRR
jgi:hypothetical protein